MRTNLCSVAILLLVFLMGCTSHRPRVRQASEPVVDRATYIEQRTNEWMRRGVPKDVAVRKAAGEWFNNQAATDRRADEARQFEQDKLNRELAKMDREQDTR